MKYLYSLLASTALSLCSCSQNAGKPHRDNQPIPGDIQAGGRCEDCATIYESPEAFEQMKLPGASPWVS